MKDKKPLPYLVQGLTYAVAAIFVLLPFHALFTAWLGSNFHHFDLFRIWKELLLTPVALACLWLVYRDKKLRACWNNSPLVALILLYVLLHLLLGAFALQAHKVTSTALIYGLLTNLRFLIFFLVCAVVTAYSDWLLKHWQKLILWPAYAVIIFGLLQLTVLPKDFLTHFGYGPGTIPAIQTVDQKLDYIRVLSTLRGPNPLGAYLVLVMTVLFALWLAGKRRLEYGIWALLSGVTLFFTYSRSAWLGLALSVVVLLWLSVRGVFGRRLILIATASGLIVLAGLIIVLRDNDFIQNTVFHTNEHSVSATSSNEVRSTALETGVKSLWDEPLGRGPGTAGPASFRNNQPRIAENYFLQIGQEVGVIGLGLFVAINVFVAWSLYRTRHALLSQVLLASLAGLMLVNMFSHAWADDTLALVWWGLAGIALSTAILDKKRKHNGTKEKTTKRTS